MKILSFLLLILILWGCKNPNPDEKIENLTKKEIIELASEYYKALDRRKAFYLINKSLKKYENDRDLLVMRGFIQATMNGNNDSDTFCKDFEAASKRGYKIQADYLIGRLCEYVKRPLPIISLIELKHFLNGIAYGKNGKMSDALDEFTEAKVLNPNNYETLYYLSQINYIFIKDTTTAYRLIEKAISLNGHYSDGYMFRGKIKQSKANYIEAMNDYNKAIQYDSDNAEAYYLRGKLYFRLNLPEKGRSDLMTANSKGHPYAFKLLNRLE